MGRVTTKWRGGVVAGLLGLSLACGGSVAFAERGEALQLAVATAADGPAYPVSRVEVVYEAAHPQHPGLEVVLGAEVRLTPTPTGYVAERPDDLVDVLTLGELGGARGVSLHASAILMISRTIAESLNDVGLVGVYVAPDEAQFDLFGRDLRGEGDVSLRMVVSTSVAGSFITVATDQDGENRRENAEEHAWIPAGSPVRPWDGEGERSDLLWVNRLEDYGFRLNRQGGRRVDVAVTAIEDDEGEPGVELEYLITEAKPWRVFAQAANTGTEQTDEWRETFGFFHNQLTGRDDQLSLTYSTAGFDESHTLTGSYAAPFERGSLWGYRGTVLYSVYDASEVGLSGANFSGETISGSGEASRQIFQRRDFFVDAFGGVSLQSQETENELAATDIQELFLIPEVGLRAEARRQTESIFGQVSLGWNVPGVNGEDLDNFGRTGADDAWALVRWSGFASFYLEPLLDRAAWEDPSTPETSTLAHEVVVRFDGQHAMGYRLIPQQQMTVGGMNTVRGYPESTIAGDTVVFGSVEYRLHTPRLLAVSSDPAQLPILGQPFRLAPPRVYGYPDWDLVFKTFLDAGATYNSETAGSDGGDSLLGTGIGVELSVKQTLQVRVDWGIGLKDVDSAGYSAGSNRFHIQAGVVY
ncbi:ShlB/FhaC/HecB family hemolysin secretion/activation protein [Mucisphaera sp.]|uniref:ShlB/FhaC/HecB family hemolysin secretion/activation protein n=1 Tax=Mucisphaera sp. TaxID=2913024 RepID=UPI003D1524AE